MRCTLLHVLRDTQVCYSVTVLQSIWNLDLIRGRISVRIRMQLRILTLVCYG
jgi:hypothetical protein